MFKHFSCEHRVEVGNLVLRYILLQYNLSTTTLTANTCTSTVIEVPSEHKSCKAAARGMGPHIQ